MVLLPAVLSVLLPIVQVQCKREYAVYYFDHGAPTGPYHNRPHHSIPFHGTIDSRIFRRVKVGPKKLPATSFLESGQKVLGKNQGEEVQQQRFEKENFSLVQQVDRRVWSEQAVTDLRRQRLVSAVQSKEGEVKVEVKEDEMEPSGGVAEHVAKVIAHNVTKGLKEAVTAGVQQTIEKEGGMNRILARIQDEKIAEARREAEIAAKELDDEGLMRAANKLQKANNMKQMIDNEEKQNPTNTGIEKGNAEEQTIVDSAKEDSEKVTSDEGQTAEKSGAKESTADGTQKKAHSSNEDQSGPSWWSQLNSWWSQLFNPENPHHRISVTCWCIMFLVFMYFVIHSGLAVAHACFQGTSSDRGSATLATFEATTPAMSNVPMLCVLFYAVRLRVVFLAQGLPEKYGLPYWWVEWGQVIACIGVLVQVCFVMGVAVATGAPPSQDSVEEGKPVHVEVGHAYCAKFMVVLQYIGTFAVHAGAAACCAGILIMHPPEEVTLHAEGKPQISIALWCVMSLSVIYFMLYMALQCVRTVNQLRGDGHSKAQDVLQLAGFVLRFVPTLCVLFMCIIIRGTQIRPLYAPPKWVDLAILGCSGGILLQLLLTVAVPTCCGGRAHKGASEADITFETGNDGSTGWAGFFELLRWVVLVGIYGGVGILLIAMFVMEDPESPVDTPRLTRSLQCTLVLTVLFFLVHLLFFLVLSCRQCYCCGGFSEEEGQRRHHCLEVLETLTETVEICPMLAILFLAARLRASLLTDHEGQPQGWAQDAMILATVSVLGQILMVFLRAFLPAASSTETGTCVRSIWAMLEVMRFVIMIGMYGGAGLVIIAMLIMTPASATETDESHFFSEHLKKMPKIGRGS